MWSDVKETEDEMDNYKKELLDLHSTVRNLSWCTINIIKTHTHAFWSLTMTIVNSKMTRWSGSVWVEICYSVIVVNVCQTAVEESFSFSSCSDLYTLTLIMDKSNTFTDNDEIRWNLSNNLPTAIYL